MCRQTIMGCRFQGNRVQQGGRVYVYKRCRCTSLNCVHTKVIHLAHCKVFPEIHKYNMIPNTHDTYHCISHLITFKSSACIHIDH